MSMIAELLTREAGYRGFTEDLQRIMFLDC